MRTCRISHAAKRALALVIVLWPGCASNDPGPSRPTEAVEPAPEPGDVETIGEDNETVGVRVDRPPDSEALERLAFGHSDALRAAIAEPERAAEIMWETLISDPGNARRVMNFMTHTSRRPSTVHAFSNRWLQSAADHGPLPESMHRPSVQRACTMAFDGAACDLASESSAEAAGSLVAHTRDGDCARAVARFYERCHANDEPARSDLLEAARRHHAGYLGYALQAMSGEQVEE